ncbi:MAG: hypothetical protein FRX49_10023 [Trebouxia sp. A1-2]|nr:MAG: hypothetical protein FRX49_10023 [Trebouxia sp. A1-2]
MTYKQMDEYVRLSNQTSARLLPDGGLAEARHPTGGEAGEPPKGGAGNLKESSLSGFSCHEP